MSIPEVLTEYKSMVEQFNWLSQHTGPEAFLLNDLNEKFKMGKTTKRRGKR